MAKRRDRIKETGDDHKNNQIEKIEQLYSEHTCSNLTQKIIKFLETLYITHLLLTLFLYLLN